MIVKTVEQLKAYLADGGDPERISIMKDPVPVKPNPVIYSGEGRHNTSTYEHSTYEHENVYYHKKGYRPMQKGYHL